MKYTITINQYAIFVNGLINKTDAIDWILIDYLKDFALYKNAKKKAFNNQEYIWLNYAHLMLNLPIVKIRTKSAITKRLAKLKALGLIKTIQDHDNTLYFTFTDKLIDCLFVKRPNQLKKVPDRIADPCSLRETDPVHFGQTAQYITKNTILNKEYKERKDFVFNEKNKKRKD